MTGTSEPTEASEEQTEEPTETPMVSKNFKVEFGLTGILEADVPQRGTIQEDAMKQVIEEGERAKRMN